MSKGPAKKRPSPAKRTAIGLIAVIALAAGVHTWVFWKAGPVRPETSGMAPTSGGKDGDAAVLAGYAGSQNCLECHADQFNLWKTSHHALAERPVNAGLDGPAFEPARTIKHGTQSSEVRRTNGQFHVVTSGLGGRAAFPAERVVGVSPLRQFLVPEKGGRWQVTELAFDPRQGDWFDIFGEEDRQPGEWGHWTGRGMTWNMMCAGCHNTRVLKRYQAGTDSYATTMAEMGVGCEACHGPMADHVGWQRRHYQPGAPPLRKTRDPTLRHFDREQMLSVCGSCHARRAELTGDFQPGDRFLDQYSLVIPDESDLYYADGQVREEDYEYTSFLSSRMKLAGVWCLDCHQPHSAKTLVNNDGLCLRCHATPVAPAPKIDPTTHSRHQLDKPGGRCVECHMPQTTYMQRHARRDHGFTIPDPLLTKQYGIPNACNRCHKDQNTDWALQAVEKWYGSRMERPTRRRAQTIAQARSGQRDTVPKLERLLRDEPIPLWRASAAVLLKRWTAEPGVTQALLERIADPDPLVRAMAARALEPLSGPVSPAVRSGLERLLQDPFRNVRIETAWSLRSGIETNSTPAGELFQYLTLNNDQPSGALQLGTFLLDRGQIDPALACFQRAVQWDGGSAPLRHALAVGLSMQGKNDEAVRELEAACRLAPREPEYPFKLGLAWNEAGKLSQAAAALEQAVKLDPQFAQAWYNLGLAFSGLGNPDRALEALARAESINPDSPAIPYARATILARVGRIPEARTAAGRALQLQPGYADAVNLLQALQQP